MTQFHDLIMKDARGDRIAFEQFAGQTCLIVNVASR
jgi:glutathione peroxidase-family protein